MEAAQEMVTITAATKATHFDIETDLVVALPPKSRPPVRLHINAVRKAEPHVALDSSDKCARGN